MLDNTVNFLVVWLGKLCRECAGTANADDVIVETNEADTEAEEIRVATTEDREEETTAAAVKTLSDADRWGDECCKKRMMAREVRVSE